MNATTPRPVLVTIYDQDRNVVVQDATETLVLLQRWAGPSVVITHVTNDWRWVIGGAGHDEPFVGIYARITEDGMVQDELDEFVLTAEFAG